MICPHCKNEIPDDSLFCVDCGEKIYNNDSVKEHNEDSFTEEGIIYYSLNPSDTNGTIIGERWIHSNNCGGSIYVGNNAICQCGKCRKSGDIKLWHKVNDGDNNIAYVDISTNEQPLQEILKILPVDRAGLKWLNQLTSKLITKNQ